jgi:C4-dicarboxylate-specific signal transduction histidine kinase
LPAEAVNERDFCLAEGLLSHLTIPFTVGEKVIGGIGFGSYRRYLNWSDELVQSLQLLGQVFANALARWRAEKNLSIFREQLIHASRVALMGELAASIAHEVNQPLCSVVTNAQAVQRLLTSTDGVSDDVREALHDIAQDGLRASAVLTRIRSSLRNSPAERMPVDPNELIHEVAALARTELARREITLKLELAKSLPMVRADRVQLQQVLLNLLTNGADAMEPIAPELREMVISSSADGDDRVVVGVKDSGIGLDPDLCNRVFDAFFTTKPHGMGMGLAICKSIIESHDGRIWAAPAAGRGTTLHLSLPASKESTS